VPEQDVTMEAIGVIGGHLVVNTLRSAASGSQERTSSMGVPCSCRVAWRLALHVVELGAAAQRPGMRSNIRM
jgi:hypothetical protein